VGVAADLVALVMPSCAASLWQTGQRATALMGWSIWLMTFVFAVTAGIGFASTNISDVTTARASRVTPAVTNAQGALTDAMTARDRECKSGVGKFCREREAAVVDRRQMLDSAVASVGQTADPQSDAAIKLVTWASGGSLRPTPEDFAMLRLVLLALLPQIGGILLLVGHLSSRK
jgi:polyferredoxin